MKKPVVLLVLWVVLFVHMAVSQTVEHVAPGIWKIVFGLIGKHCPVYRFLYGIERKTR